MKSQQEIRRIGLIGASFETGNMGVGALAAGAIRCIRRQWPSTQIFILDYAHHSSRREVCFDDSVVEVSLHNMRFSKRLFMWNNIVVLMLCAILYRVLPLRVLRSWLASKHTTLREIFACDLFLSIAGGDSFSDIYGLSRFFYVALPQILVILTGKELILLPQTYGPFRTRIARGVAAFITSHADRLFTRDLNSIEIIQQLNSTRRSIPRAAFRYDVGFVLEPTKPSNLVVAGLDIETTQPVGLNVSGLLYMGGYNRKNMFGLNFNYQELIEKTLHLLIVEKGTPVLLIPHVFGGGRNSESDVAACEAVYERYAANYAGRLAVLRGDYHQGEVKHVIGRCDFFIGSRMHACIAAISQCVPAVAVAYSDKFIGVMETIAIPSVVVDARSLTIESLLVRIGEQYDNREMLRQYLNMAMPKIIQEAFQIFSDSPAVTRRVPDLSPACAAAVQ